MNKGTYTQLLRTLHVHQDRSSSTKHLYLDSPNMFIKVTLFCNPGRLKVLGVKKKKNYIKHEF